MTSRHRALPSQIEHLRGLRARGYIRVSSREQGSKYGPEGQEQTVTEETRRAGLVTAGDPFRDTQSAWSKSEERPGLNEIVAEAAKGSFDVLVVAYFSRWSRDTEIALRMRRELHDRNVVVLFADEGFLSSDEESYGRYLDEAVQADKFSHRLSRNIARTFKAKFERYGDQAGTAGLGFYRTPQPEARLAVASETMPAAVALFERYALGNLSFRELAEEAGMEEGAVRGILVNRLYNGWAVRARRSGGEVFVPAPWRLDPPVSDELWAKVSEVRARRQKAAGRQRSRHIHLLAKLMYCTCGRLVRADTSRQVSGKIVKRYVHEGCDLWVRENIVAHRLDDPIIAQLSGIELSEEVLSNIEEIAGRPVPEGSHRRRAQLEAARRRCAVDNAEGRLSDEAYLAEKNRLNAEIAALDGTEPRPVLNDAAEVVARLRSFRATWEGASEAARADLVAQIYDRIIVVNGEIVAVSLTDSAKRMGLPLALPENVALARPARLELTAFRSAT